MRGRKRLRKKLLKKKSESKAIFTVSLELGESLSPGESLGVVEQFRDECLKPEGLLFDAKPSGIGWNGKIKNTNRSLLTQEHREMIADWAFMQEDVNSYCISRLSKE